MEWTKNQKKAICSLNGTVLVSAAAGSGKTAVLVERVIKRLTDERNKVYADELLIVTFTNAAAAEMKERILCKLSSLIDKNQGNKHLERQQILLGSAHISTVHSFCSDLIREYSCDIGVSPDFRILESSELDVIKEEAINIVLERLYSEHNNSSFYDLIRFFSPFKNDENFIKVLFNLHDFLLSIPFKNEWMNEKLEMYENFSKRLNGEVISDWEKTIFNYTEEIIKNCINITERSIEILEDERSIKEVYSEAFEADKKMFEKFKSIISDTEWRNWNKIGKELNNLKFKRLGSLRKDKVYSVNKKDIVYNNREIVKNEIKKLNNIFALSREENAKDISYLSSIIKSLFDVVLLFDNEFKKIKEEKNVLDFSDLEHYALEILFCKIDDKYVRSERAKEISKRFKEIMVDEYQDSATCFRVK